MQNFNVSNAVYDVHTNLAGQEVGRFIQATIDGQELSVPLDPANRHYAEILKQVAAGTLTIQDAD